MKLVIRKHKGAKKIKILKKSIKRHASQRRNSTYCLLIFVQCVYLCVFINTIQQIIIIIIQHKRKRKEIHKTLYYLSLPE